MKVLFTKECRNIRLADKDHMIFDLGDGHYVDISEKLVAESIIEPEYEIDDVFGKYGFKNRAGQFVIEPQYAYSDVVLMLQSMTDQEIMEHIGIKYATYYRHKKKLLESEYYKFTDKNRLTDELYLQGEELNIFDSWF